MVRQPGGDIAVEEPWNRCVAHRPAALRARVVERFEENGIVPELVQRVLEDGGDALYDAARSGAADWADEFGGRLAAALLAAEVSALAAHLNERASAVRSLAVDALLEEFSAITVASRLGVARQKVYDIAHGGRGVNEFIARAPWRQT